MPCTITSSPARASLSSRQSWSEHIDDVKTKRGWSFFFFFSVSFLTNYVI